MLRKGWHKCVTFVLATTFLITSVVATPLAVGAAEEGDNWQVQEESSKAVEEFSMASAGDSESKKQANNADFNEATEPEQDAETTQPDNSEETVGGEPSEKDDVSDDVTAGESQVGKEESSQESQIEEDDEGQENGEGMTQESQPSSSDAEDSSETSETDESSRLEEGQKAAEGSMELEQISLFSNANLALLATDEGVSLLSAGANDSNMGLAPGIKFHKFEIQYNKYDSNTVEYIVIHDTGNPGVGADAMAHYQYFSGGDRNASAHYFVDEGQVVQIIDDSEGSWHSGVRDKTPATPISNHNSIGIEMCINADGDYNGAMRNTIDLAAYLLWKYDLSMDRLVRHYDANGKVCPLTMAGNNWARWQEFEAAVRAKRNTYTGKYPGNGGGSGDQQEGVQFSNNILGNSTLGADALVQYLMENNASIGADYAKRVANTYLDLGKIYGIRGDIAFFQSMLETNKLKYGGEVDISYNNFCGMKAPGDKPNEYDYVKFATMEEGVEAHIQHIYCYATTAPIPEGRKLVDPRFDDWLRGKSTTWEGMGGIWAQPGYDPNEYADLNEARDKHGSYGDIIIRMYASAGGTGVQTGPMIPGSKRPGSGDGGYWDNPIYTGGAAGTRNVIKKGSTGSDVKEIQGYLKTIGYSYVSVTGIFDDNTERAVKDIQKKNNLDSDGVVGENSWAVIINTYVEAVLGGAPDIDPGDKPGGDKPTDKPDNNPSDGNNKPIISVTGRSLVYSGCSGEDVKALQELLSRIGYNLTVDGIFGAGTDSAVRDFQKKNGLVADGYVGENTWKKLGEKGNAQDGNGNGGNNGSAEKPEKPNQPGNGSGGNISVSGRSLVYNGCTGDDVKALQQILNQLGYKMSADGIFGSTTDAAVRDFQKKNGLVPDGYVGENTWKKLGDKLGSGSGDNNSGNNSGGSGSSGGSNNGGGISVSGRALVSYGSTGDDVKALQQLLNKLGYKMSADGIFGSTTDAAVRDFQKKNGLVADGQVGTNTWKKLGEKAGSGSNNSGNNSGGSGSSGGSNNGGGISVSGRSLVSYGSTGDDVKALQQLLNKLGYKMSADGIFGSTTDAAVRDFQKKNGLVADGYVGENTWKKLGEKAGSSGGSGSTGGSSSSNAGRPTLSMGDSGADVTALQKALNKHGYGLVVDGIFGGSTYSAVQSFQRSKGIGADGIVGPKTWAKL